MRNLFFPYASYEGYFKSNITYFFTSEQNALQWRNLEGMLCRNIWSHNCISWWTITYNGRIGIVIVELQIRSLFNCLAAATELLSLHENEGKALFDRLITGDETWVHHPIIKKQSMVWKRTDKSMPKKFKTTPSAGKVMTAFWTLKVLCMKNTILMSPQLTHKHIAKH